MYVCTYVCTYVHTYVRMYVCSYIIAMYVCMYVCIYVCTYVCMHVKYALLHYVCNRDATIWVNTILHIAFECIAIYCHIAIFDIMSLN